MSFKELGKALFGAPPDIVWPSMPALPTGTRVRCLGSDDHARCVEVYRANEKGRFPAGFEPTLRESLVGPHYLWVGLMVNDRLIAFGGVTRAPAIRFDHAWLVFGMVDPVMHGRGLGSCLLLTRLSALPRPAKPVKVMMSNVRGVQAFFERFGFTHQGEIIAGNDGARLDSSAATLREPAWRQGREMLQAQGLSIDTLVVPEADLWSLPGATPDESEGRL